MMNSTLGCGAAVQAVPQGFGCRAGMLPCPHHSSFWLKCLPGTKGLVLLCPKESQGCLRHPPAVFPGEGPRRDPFTRGRRQGEEVGLVVEKKFLYLG